MERKSEFKINNLILNRWSPRSMSAESIEDKELLLLLEAAKWAPSSSNNQLWRFIYAKRDTKHWDNFFNLLAEGNQIWCKNASALIIIISRKIAYYKDKPQKTHSFESGAAMQNLLLQASDSNLIAHAMAGFDYDKTHKLLKLNDNWNVECMIAVGKPGKKEDLPEESQKMEMPSDRKPLNELVFEGEFKAD